MRKLILLSMICMAPLFGPGVFADTLSWKDVLNEALKNNPDLANARNSLELADISYKSSFLNFFPDFSGSMGMRKSGSGGTSYSLGLNGSLSLFNGFQNTNQLRIRRTGLSMQEAIYKRSVADFIYNLRISFAYVLKTQKTIALLNMIEARRKNNMELVRLRYDAGREDKGAYLRSEADYLQAQYETRKQERSYRIVKAELMKNIGTDIYEQIDITGTFDIPDQEEKPSDALLRVNPDYIIAKYRMESSMYELKYKYGDLYPNIGLSGSLSKSGSDWPPQDDSWSMGLSLSYPFFSGGRDLYDLKSAKLDKLVSENDLKSAEHDIMLEIESSYNDLTDAVEYYRVSGKYYAARRERSEISKEKYLNGLISYQDWDSIENEYISAQKSLLEAQYNVFASWAKWQRVIGEEE